MVNVINTFKPKGGLLDKLEQWTGALTVQFVGGRYNILLFDLKMNHKGTGYGESVERTSEVVWEFYLKAKLRYAAVKQ